MKRILVAVLAMATMHVVAADEANRVLGTMVYGESLDDGLGQLTELDMRPYMQETQTTEAAAEESNSVLGEKQDSGLGAMVYGESLDSGLGAMVYGESLDDGLGQLTALDMRPYIEQNDPVHTASIQR